ncbi:hypothetical protein [Nocardia sp. NPDC050793]|uniref:hypothetical protein n=1 Tax=Nocardia sp. NPDC050793 TaxID=3155159 RepID=UPI00340781ED
MRIDLARYLARVQLDPNHQRYLREEALPGGPVLIVGHHAAFATSPRPGTPIAVFPGIEPATPATDYPILALVRVEHATGVITVADDGTSRIHWEENVFPGLPTGISWYLRPAELDPATGRWVLAAGRWAAGGCHAQLPRSVTTQVPGAPSSVAIHDQDSHTGRRWPS